MIKRIVRTLGRRLLDQANVCPTPMIANEKLASLIRHLQPRSCGKDLIRLGPKGDGGYLLPDDLVGVEACFSPGVSNISGFEVCCANLGMDVFMADRSVDGPAAVHSMFRFLKKYIGAFTSDAFITIDDWIASARIASEAELLLQIDIEGYEYETFLSTSTASMTRFRVIVAEFHNLHWLWSEPFFRLASSTFEKILQTHTCVHLHPNNCCGSSTRYGIEIPCVMEFTFLRNDRFAGTGFCNQFPHPLDYDNTTKQTLTLPTCWYGHL